MLIGVLVFFAFCMAAMHVLKGINAAPDDGGGDPFLPPPGRDDPYEATEESQLVGADYRKSIIGYSDFVQRSAQRIKRGHYTIDDLNIRAESPESKQVTSRARSFKIPRMTLVGDIVVAVGE